jgi:hypothetical protein
VEGHRRYADEPEPSWFSGNSPYEAGPDDRPSDGFRLPDQRTADGGYGPPAPYRTTEPGISTGAFGLPPDPGAMRMPVRGPEYPTIRPTGGNSLADVPPAPYGASAAPSSGLPAANGPDPHEQTGLVPGLTDVGQPGGEAVYRTRRPLSALLIAIVTVLLLVPVVVLLVRVTFVDDPTVRGIVPAVLLTLGLPLTGIGLYALAAGGSAGRDVWLRPPVAYLPVGVVLLLAAGLSVA